METIRSPTKMTPQKVIKKSAKMDSLTSKLSNMSLNLEKSLLNETQIDNAKKYAKDILKQVNDDYTGKTCHVIVPKCVNLENVFGSYKNQKNYRTKLIAEKDKELDICIVCGLITFDIYVRRTPVQRIRQLSLMEISRHTCRTAEALANTLYKIMVLSNQHELIIEYDNLDNYNGCDYSSDSSSECM